MQVASATHVNSNTETQEAARRASNAPAQPVRVNIAPAIYRLQRLLDKEQAKVRLLEERVDHLEWEKSGLRLELEEFKETVTGKRLKSLESKYSIQIIVRRVCQVYGVTEEDITSKRRSRRLLLARKACYYFAYTYTKFSLPDIGAALGKDHSTVLSGYRRYRDRSRFDKKMVRQSEAG